MMSSLYTNTHKYAAAPWKVFVIKQAMCVKRSINMTFEE